MNPFDIAQPKVYMVSSESNGNLVAAAIFLLLGFGWKLWHPAWIAFPIGGLLCGIISVIFPETEL